MKKTLLAVSILFATSVQAGEYVKVSGEYRNGRNGTQDSETFGITIGTNIDRYLDAELQSTVKSNDDDTNNTRVEAALIGKYPILSRLSLYARGAIGEKFNGSTNDEYLSIEPGVRYSVSPDLNLKAGLRFRESIDLDNDSTTTFRVSGGYNLTKTSIVSLGYDRSYGDSEYDAVNLGYTIAY